MSTCLHPLVPLFHIFQPGVSRPCMYSALLGPFLRCLFQQMRIEYFRLQSFSEAATSESTWECFSHPGNDPLNPMPCLLGVHLQSVTFCLASRILEVKGTSGLQAQSPIQLVQKHPTPHALCDKFFCLLLLMVSVISHHCVLRRLGSSFLY